ncbi:LysR substrate-binding domain-containing protein [Agrobacterium tumefaciens]|uniref:LysR substrate-binding domain-containing protein n=1 Tax=Agrobacterium tumefaciens TaxID=358 RepID=UPI002243EEE7|nr:LysR substrate-binding domain-containing protein [Agrobacterium tumefaciens]MCW8143070.1 LysR substrate-binding domain-containing protein [Agrobacterium tumefaciens]
MRIPSLRQIEALIAFVEAGTVSRAADALRISQPAASKLLGTLEMDTELQLFERDGRRLALTPQGMRLYKEIDRVFTGVQQIARAVDAIRREERGRLIIGVIPALSGPVIRKAVSGLLDRYPDVYVSVMERSSQIISDWLVRGQLDVGIVSAATSEVRIRSEDIGVEPLVCVVPRNHRLAQRNSISLNDLQDERFIAFSSNNIIRLEIDKLFESHGVVPNVILDADTAKNACEFVASGLGISIIHPLTIVKSLRDEVSILRLEPSKALGFHFCHPQECRNMVLVDAFADEVHKAVADSLASPADG